MSSSRGMDKKLKETLQNNNIEPRDFVWDTIEAALTKRKKKSRVLFLVGTTFMLSSIGLQVTDKLKKPEQIDPMVKTVPKTEVDSKFLIEKTSDTLRSIPKSKSIITKNKKIEYHTSNTSDFNSNTIHQKPEKKKPKSTIFKDSLPIKPKLEKPKETKPRTKKKQVKPKGKGVKPSFFNGGSWSVSSQVVLDSYHSFHENIGVIVKPNYGLFLNYFSGRHLIRVGYKRTAYEFTQNNFNRFERQYLEYQEVPVEIKYFFGGNEKFRPAVFWGVSFLSLKEASLTEESIAGSPSRDNRERFNRFNFTLSPGIGLETKLNRNFSMHIEAQFKYHVNTLQAIKNASTYSISANIGIEYKL